MVVFLDRLEKNYWLLPNVDNQKVLDQLQYSRGSILDSESSDYNPWTYIWSSDMAIIFLQPFNKCHVNLGKLQKTTAYTGWIQHTLDLAEHDGVSTTFIGIMYDPIRNKLHSDSLC